MKLKWRGNEMDLVHLICLGLTLMLLMIMKMWNMSLIQARSSPSTYVKMVYASPKLSKSLM